MSAQRTPGAGAFPERTYAALLKALPRDILDHHGTDAVELFRDLYREALRREGRGAAVALWLRSLGNVLLCAAQERWERMRAPGRPGGGNHKQGTGGSGPGKGMGDGMENLAQDVRYALRSFARR